MNLGSGGGEVKMDSTLKGFILFCIERRGRQWPALYDEMAKVASSRLFHGMGYADLRSLGLSLSLDSIETTRLLVSEVLAGKESPAGLEECVGVRPGKVAAKLTR
jgi:hypothetical protein